jgi:hypothetical protein
MRWFRGTALAENQELISEPGKILRQYGRVNDKLYRAPDENGNAVFMYSSSEKEPSLLWISMFKAEELNKEPDTSSFTKIV